MKIVCVRWFNLLGQNQMGFIVHDFSTLASFEMTSLILLDAYYFHSLRSWKYVIPVEVTTIHRVRTLSTHTHIWTTSGVRFNRFQGWEECVVRIFGQNRYFAENREVFVCYLNSPEKTALNVVNSLEEKLKIL